MNKIKYLLIFIVLLGFGLLSAQPVSVNFKDATASALTQAALNVECQAQFGANYTSTFPVSANKWRFQWYRDGGDGIMSPLDPITHEPTGDDIASVGAVSPGNTVGPITIGPTGLWAPGAATFNQGSGAGNTLAGDRVFIRFFNANSIATATKTMCFTALYTITTGGTQVIQPYIPAYAWGAWTPIAAGHTLQVTSNYIGAAIYKDGGPTGQVTPYTFPVPAASGTYTLVMPNVAWTPLSYVYDGQTNASINFVGVFTPGAATSPNPYEGEVLHIAWDANATPYILTWVGPNGVTASGYHIYWQGGFVIDVTTPTWTTPAIAVGDYTWKVVPYVTDPAKGVTRDLSPVAYQVTKKTNNASKGNSTSAVDWHFSIVRDAEPQPAPTQTWPPIGDTNLPYQQVSLIWTMTSMLPNSSFDIFLDTNPAPTTQIANDITNMYYIINNQLAPMTHYYWFVRYNYPDTRGHSDTPVWDFWTGDNGLPVELTSFTAVYTADLFVQLNWVVASETNHMGYYVLRNDSNEMAEAINLNPAQPINTGSTNGTQITYNYRDDQLAANQTYYYWLQSVDLGGQNQFFGPISVIVAPGQDPITPPIIPGMNTTLLNAYPNPFNASISSSIPYYLKDAANVKIEICNVKGNVVYSFTASDKAAGYHTVNWNGKDSNGKSVASGIYYYRMTSGKFTASKKIVLVK